MTLPSTRPARSGRRNPWLRPPGLSPAQNASASLRRPAPIIVRTSSAGARPARPGRQTSPRLVVLSLMVPALLLLAHTLLPLWLQVVMAVVVVVLWALWATCPPDQSLARHAAAWLGQIVLDALTAAARLAVTLALVVAVLAASWSFLEPRVVAALGHLQARTVATVKDAVTPGLPALDVRSVGGDVGHGIAGVWRTLTGTPEKASR